MMKYEKPIIEITKLNHIESIALNDGGVIGGYDPKSGNGNDLDFGEME